MQAACQKSLGFSSHATRGVQVKPPMMKNTRQKNSDKLNSIDFHWLIVRTLPHQEEKLAGMLKKHQTECKNILEVYCPTHTTATIVQHGKEMQKPLFAGYVFALSTQQALVDFIGKYYPEGTVKYRRKESEGGAAGLFTVPEEQMRAFMDFNENYAEHVILLERPYSDYAFNPKTNEPNEIVKVVDGPLAGREGYLVKFRRDKRMVFNIKSVFSDGYMAVSIPNVWNLHVVRLHNAEGDRQTAGTMKDRAIDLLVGILQGCGYSDMTLPVMYEIIDFLTVKPSLVELCNHLYRHGHGKLSQRIAAIGMEEARLVMELIRYERNNCGYVKRSLNKLVIRPFLTPTPGIPMEEEQTEESIPGNDFTEIIRKVRITEQVYYPSRRHEEDVTSTYYAHIGAIIRKDDKRVVLFTNWDKFLGEYFLTAGRANEHLVGSTVACPASPGKGGNDKLIESFRNFAPTLYSGLTDKGSEVKAVRNFRVGKDSLNVMAITTTEENTDTAKEKLATVCIKICKEINTTTHLAVWRRYLRSVWLHE